MKSLPTNLLIEKNKMSTSAAWLVLLEITLPDTTVLRFVRNNEDISFGGNTYTAFPFEIDPAKRNSKGEIQNVQVRIGNITRLIEPYLESFDGGIGSTVKITVVNSDRLTEDYSETEINYDVIGCESNSKWVTFSLGSPNPLRRKFPLHRYNALLCRFKYNDVDNKAGKRCQYAGETITGITQASNAKVSCTAHPFAVGDAVKFADVNGMTSINGQTGTVQDADPDADGNAFTVDIDSTAYNTYTSGGICGYATCNRTLAHCRERDNSARFGGCPGIRTGGIKIA